MTSSKSSFKLAKNAAEGKRFGIVASRYHEELTTQLVEGAVETLESLGARKSDVTVAWVPGAFEIPLAARMMSSQSPDAILCLGVVIKGETTHDEYIASEVAHGIAMVGQAAGMPVMFGVLTTQTLEQAKARCGGAKGNKGSEAAEGAVAMIHTLEEIKKGPGKSVKSVGF